MRLAASLRTARYFSWFNRAENASKQRAMADFKKEVTFLASKTSYNLIDYRQRVLDGLAQAGSSIKAKFMQADDKGETQMIQQRKILNAMFEAELQDPDSITGKPILLSRK